MISASRGRQLANTSTGGQAQTRLRSPPTLSMRETGGQYLEAKFASPAGNAAIVREYGWDHSSAIVSAEVCGAFTSGLSSSGHVPSATLDASRAMPIIASQ